LIIVMAAAFALIISRPTLGSTNTADQEKMFKAWLEVINPDNDAQDIEKFIHKYYVPRLIDMSPMAEHVAIIQNLSEKHGKLEFHSFRENTDDRLLALIRNSHDQWILVTLYFDPQRVYSGDSLSMTAPTRRMCSILRVSMTLMTMRIRSLIMRPNAPPRICSAALCS